jgi:hypothetical protein
MVDNFEQIKKLLNYNSEADFYFLQIMRRKKENPTLTSNTKIIDELFINSNEYLDTKKEYIIQMCNMFNARATIRLNRRSYKTCSLQSLSNLAQQIANGQSPNVSRLYSSVVGKYHNEPIKRWIIDIDQKEIDSTMLPTLERIKPIGNKLIDIIPSKNGYHIITSPFDVSEFSKMFPNIDIHKDNPTNLYIP